MAQNYFRYLPDFDYISRLPDSKNIGDYIRVKNIFKRVKLREDIANDATYFTKYQVLGDERPDNTANIVYGDSRYDWVILLSNNIINIETEWPLSNEAYEKYLYRKYGTEENINAPHHYETTEVRNYNGRVLCPKGLEVPQDYSFVFFDDASKEERIATQITREVTNKQYEDRRQEKLRNIFVLKPKYLNLVIDDMENALKYYPGGSQYESPTVTKGENIRLY